MIYFAYTEKGSDRVAMFTDSEMDLDDKDRYAIPDGTVIDFTKPHRIVNGTLELLVPALDQAKADQWKLIKAARDEVELGGFIWDSSTFDSNQISQQRINGAVTLAMLNSAFVIDWTLADNSVRSLTAAEMLQVGGALGVHVGTQFAIGQAKRAQIMAATSIIDVQAITF